MGKFVQLSTQIRTYRNCRGEGGGEGDALCFHVCVCVVVRVCRETQASLRPDTEYSKKKKKVRRKGGKKSSHTGN